MNDDLYTFEVVDHLLRTGDRGALFALAVMAAEDDAEVVLEDLRVRAVVEDLDRDLGAPTGGQDLAERMLLHSAGFDVFDWGTAHLLSLPPEERAEFWEWIGPLRDRVGL